MAHYGHILNFWRQVGEATGVDDEAFRQQHEPGSACLTKVTDYRRLFAIGGI